MKPTITFEDFQKVDLRTGTIIDAKTFPKARKPAYQVWIDFGSLGIKKTSAQITDLYQPEELLGKQVVAVVNFESKQIANFKSECLLLGIVRNNQSVVLLQTNNSVQNGESIQ